MLDTMLTPTENAMFLKFGFMVFTVYLKLSVIPSLLESLGDVYSLFRNRLMAKKLVSMV